MFSLLSLLLGSDNDSGLASYVARQIDRTLSWKVCFVLLLLPPPSSHHILRDLESCIGVVNVQDVKWLQSITSMLILVKGVVTAEDGKLLLFLFPSSLWLSTR
jgi:hypothetical protein